jgi:hypothetical protein
VNNESVVISAATVGVDGRGRSGGVLHDDIVEIAIVLVIQ